jgi:nickel transport protein
MALEGTNVSVFVDEQPIGEAVIDADGLFIWQTTSTKDHHFNANMGAGHVANFMVSAEELGDYDQQTSLQTQNNASAQTLENAPKLTSSTGAVSANNYDRIRKMINKEIRPLRKEIILLKEKKSLQDIMGGLGYIVGIFGIFAWFKSRKTTPSKKTNIDNT